MFDNKLQFALDTAEEAGSLPHRRRGYCSAG